MFDGLTEGLASLQDSGKLVQKKRTISQPSIAVIPGIDGSADKRTAATKNYNHDCNNKPNVGVPLWRLRCGQRLSSGRWRGDGRHLGRYFGREFLIHVLLLEFRLLTQVLSGLSLMDRRVVCPRQSAIYSSESRCQ